MSQAREVDLRTLGCEIGSRKSSRIDTAIRAAFALAAMVVAIKAGAQGGPCLSNCGDHPLPPIIVTPGGPGDITPGDPCPGNRCGPGNDVPPDEGGAPTTPPKPTACETFLKNQPPPPDCRLSVPVKEPRLGSGCNFTAPSFMPMFMSLSKHFKAACNTQMQCYWTMDDKAYCDNLVRQEAYAGCASISISNIERDDCVDKAGIFLQNMERDARDMNLMRFDDVRASVKCTRWKADYRAACPR